MNLSNEFYEINKRREFISQNYIWKNKEFFQHDLFFDLDDLEEYGILDRINSDYSSENFLDKKSIFKHSENIFSFKIFETDQSNKIIDEALNFMNSNLPIVSALQFASNYEELKSCILNEFCDSKLNVFVKKLNKIIKFLFPSLGEISTDDFFSFFTVFSDENHSSLHSDESHITVSICLRNEENKDIKKIEQIQNNINKGDFVFYDGSEITIKQNSNHALIFLGDIPHKTMNCEKRTRYNLNFYFKQYSPNVNICKFYDELYINYLSLMGIRNLPERTCKNSSQDFIKIEKNNILKFQIPQLPKMKFYPSKNKNINSKKTHNICLFGINFSPNLIEMIFQYLENKSIQNIELTSKMFNFISNNIFKKKYFLKAKHTLESKKNFDQNIVKLDKNLKELEEKNNINYKNLLYSHEISEQCIDEERKILTIHMDDANLGNSYINHINKTHFIKNNMMQIHSERATVYFKESVLGLFKPRSIIVNTNPFGDYIENDGKFQSSNFYDHNNSENYLDFSNNLEEEFLNYKEILHEEIRKQSEIANKLEIYITLSNNPINFYLMRSLYFFMQENYVKKPVIVAPLFSDKFIEFSPIILETWIRDFNVMQYEKDIIELTTIKQITNLKNSLQEQYNSVSTYFQNYSNYLFIRGLFGVMSNIKEISNLTPYPGISLLQQSFSPSIFGCMKNTNYGQKNNLLNLNLSTVEVCSESIVIPIMHKRSSEIINLCGLNLQFFGDVAPKDIMAAVGNLKCRRNIKFVDWCPTGFKCFTDYTPEKLYDLIIPRSCHSLSNSNDSADFYQKLKSSIDKEKVVNSYQKFNDLNNFDCSVDEIREFIDQMNNDYLEIYSPVEPEEEIE